VASSAFYHLDDEGLTLIVRAAPKASQNRILGVMNTSDGRAVKIAVTAVPDKGKANTAVTALLAKAFDVAKNSVTLVSGSTDRHKVVRVVGDPVKLAAIADQWSDL
jgi:uncharacterized protein